MNDRKLVNVHVEIANHAGEIAKLFKPGAKVTILVRVPTIPDSNAVITDDKIDLVIAALTELKSKQETKLTSADFARNLLGIG